MKLVVIVPAYNAARHLPAIIARIGAAGLPGLDRVVIVDDGSADDTGAVARALAAGGGAGGHASALTAAVVVEVISRPRNGGYGAAMKDGLSFARARDADLAASVHADGQYSPEVLPGLLASLDRRGLDLLQGSRIAGGSALAGGMPRYKYLANWLLNKLERLVFGLPLTDFHSGYLVYGRRALGEIPFPRLSDSFDFDIQVIASARARGLGVGEDPIPTHYGDEISYLNPLTYGLRVLRVLWRYWRGEYAR